MPHARESSNLATSIRCLSLSLTAVLVASVGCASAARGNTGHLPGQTAGHSQVTSRALLVSDGCTWFPEGAWHACCVQHDERYFIGGSLRQKLDADRSLAACVSRAGHPLVGSLMFLGTQLGGIPWLPTPFRWGFGNVTSHQSVDAVVTPATDAASASTPAAE